MIVARIDSSGTLMTSGKIIEENGTLIVMPTPNGDFSQGYNGWSFINVDMDSVEVGDNILKFTTTGEVPPSITQSLYFDCDVTQNHLYYAYANVKFNGTMQLRVTNYLFDEKSSNGDWIKLSGLIESRGTFNRQFGIRVTDTVPKDVEVKNIFFLNLTETFGEGREPSKEVCDRIFANYFEGEDVVDYPPSRLSLSKGGITLKELIEVENRNVFFEDNFEDADINPLWEVEPFGSNPNALGVGIHEGKFRMINTITGHGSFALFTKLPNVNEGKVIISFDWMSYNKTTNVNYRAGQVAIRKNVLSRGNSYGTSTYDNDILIIRAMQSENASWNNFVIPSVAYEVSSYNIILDLDKNKISVYNNGVLVGVEEKVIDLGGYYLEFAYGGYSLGTYSLIDNVNIVVKENMPMVRVRSNVLEINELIEGVDL